MHKKPRRTKDVDYKSFGEGRTDCDCQASWAKPAHINTFKDVFGQRRRLYIRLTESPFKFGRRTDGSVIIESSGHGSQR